MGIRNFICSNPLGADSDIRQDFCPFWSQVLIRENDVHDDEKDYNEIGVVENHAFHVTSVKTFWSNESKNQPKNSHSRTDNLEPRPSLANLNVVEEL